LEEEAWAHKRDLARKKAELAEKELELKE